MSDLSGNAWLYVAIAGAIAAAAWFVFGRLSSRDNYDHKRSDDKEQDIPMASVTPPRKGDYTLQQLAEHNGGDVSKAILLSLFSASHLY
jgi:hypothetical protein